MLTARRGRTFPLVLVGVLLLPPVAATADGRPAPARTCVTGAVPELSVDLPRACQAVRRAVPSWSGTAQLVVGDGDPAVAAETLGDTVTVHRQAWAGLTAEARQAVLTHELVHVATAALTTPRTPLWLVEGLAEAVAWRDVRTVPDRRLAQELAAEVRAGHLPAALPTEDDFAATPALAYQQAWLAADLLLRDAGVEAVLAGGLPDDFLAAWRAELVRRLA